MIPLLLLLLLSLSLSLSLLYLRMKKQRRALQESNEPDGHVEQSQSGSMPRSRHQTRTLRHHETVVNHVMAAEMPCGIG